jgi:trehalose 6-phosphate phosphatase
VAFPAGWSQRLAPWWTDPARAGVFTDFDGTIAAIVDDPTDAAPLPGATGTLERLAGRYQRVAVISGRPVAYLIERLGGATGVLLYGLYGLERATGGNPPAVDIVPGAARWRPIVDRIAARADTEAPAGVGVEHKGLAVTLHVRTAPQHAGWVATWAEARAGETGLVVHPGKKSVELRPPVDANKGTVLTELSAGLDAVCFVGDDRGDLPAFRALTDLARAGATVLRIAVASDEAPVELLAAADLTVEGPSGALGLLEQLATGPDRH